MDWRGFELHPETPVGGVELDRVFGPGTAEQMGAYMRRFAASFGVSDMRQPARMPNTRRALAAAEFARERGRGRLDAFRREAMDAYWRDGLDLEDAGVVRAIAAAAGLEPAPTAAAMNDSVYLARVDEVRAEATAAGVTGIPTFFLGDEVVVGCQPYSVLAGAAERAGAQRRPGR